MYLKYQKTKIWNRFESVIRDLDSLSLGVACINVLITSKSLNQDCIV